MRSPQFWIFRGSTPTLELELPFPAAPEDVIYLTLSQGSEPRVEYAINGTPDPYSTGSLAISPEDPRLLVAGFTQRDTLNLRAGDCSLQVRIRTSEGADTFLPLRGFVGEVQKGGEI